MCIVRFGLTLGASALQRLIYITLHKRTPSVPLYPAHRDRGQTNQHKRSPFAPLYPPHRDLGQTISINAHPLFRSALPSSKETGDNQHKCTPSVPLHSTLLKVTGDNQHKRSPFAPLYPPHRDMGQTISINAHPLFHSTLPSSKETGDNQHKRTPSVPLHSTLLKVTGDNQHKRSPFAPLYLPHRDRGQSA